jgi:hypothetical protein
LIAACALVIARGTEVTIDSPRTVELVEVTGHRLRAHTKGVVREPITERVCESPCGVEVSYSDARRFMIRAPGLTPTDEFQLPDAGPALLLRVRPGVGWKWGTGVVALGLGAALTTFGAVLAAASHTDSRPPGPGLALGLCGVGLGTAIVVTGLVLVLGNVTTVSFASQSPSQSEHAPSRSPE